MENIDLESEVLKVIKINRKTKAKMFENLQVGSVIQFSVPIKRAGRNRGSFATYIQARNLGTGEVTKSSFNQLPGILDAFEFEICQ